MERKDKRKRMTPNKEDYLKCIYEIGTEMQKITNKEIAYPYASLSTCRNRDDQTHEK
jgi:iron-dependent repressor